MSRVVGLEEGLRHWRPPRWLGGAGAFGGHAQTIWPALFSRRYEGAPPRWRRERWHTPDGDFVDVDHQLLEPALPAGAPWLVLFHGLEGSSSSHYAQAFAHWARVQGWHCVVPHFRGCSGEINLAPRAYHSGDYEEVGWMLAQLRARHTGPMVAVGVSLGGNALLRWAQEAGDSGTRLVRAVAAVSSPIDLAAGGRAIGRGVNGLIYNRMFLRSLRPKALAKLAQHPGLFDAEKLQAVRDLYDFDNLFTAPLHGFRNTDDYWARASAKPHLKSMRHLPALVLNARNDPFVPAECLPGPGDVGPAVTLWQPAHGGHVGFPTGRFPGHVMTLPAVVMDWMRSHV